MQEASWLGRLLQLTRMSLTAEAMVMLALNMIGATSYVVAASHGGWAIPEERAAGIHTTTGEPLIWALSILPIISAFFFINIAWVAALFARRHWKGGLFWLLAAGVWLGAVVIDFAHH